MVKDPQLTLDFMAFSLYLLYTNTTTNERVGNFVWDGIHFRQGKEVTVCSEIALCADPALALPLCLFTFPN